MVGGCGDNVVPRWDAQHLIGARVRIDLDVVDHDGYFAHKSTTVTLGAPPGFYSMETKPPCMH